MKTAAVVLLLAAFACGGDEPRTLKLAPLTLPVASHGVADKDDDPCDRVICEIDALGRVHVAGQPGTLDALVSHVIERKKRYDEKTKGKGYEKLPHGGLASRLYALLRVHKDVPWQHVQWLLTLLAEQRIYRIQFAVKRVADRSYRREEATALGAKWVDRAPPEKPRLEAKLKSFLPTDKGLLGGWKQPPEIVVGVHIVCTQHGQGRWGPDARVVELPTALEYRFGDRVAKNLGEVAQWIRDAKRATAGVQPPVPVVGQIKAGHKVPFKHVVALLNRFREHGIGHVDFYGTSIPGKELRKVAHLPYPLKNYPTK
jgi:biopolymer transport protein ExbD